MTSHDLYPPPPVTNCHTFSDPLPLGAWHTLWTAPLLQTRSLQLCANFIELRQHNIIIMKFIWEQDDFRLLIINLGRRKLKKRHILKRTICRLLIDALEIHRRIKKHVLTNIPFEAPIRVWIKILSNHQQQMYLLKVNQACLNGPFSADHWEEKTDSIGSVRNRKWSPWDQKGGEYRLHKRLMGRRKTVSTRSVKGGDKLHISVGMGKQAPWDQWGREKELH